MEEYLNVGSIAEMFRLDYYTLLLSQEQIDVYNAVIGGRTVEGQPEIQGLNQLINLYNQTHKESKLPKFKMLFKQILSDRSAISWMQEPFAPGKDDEVIKAIKESYDTVNYAALGNLKLLLKNISSYQLDGIYIKNDQQLNTISKKAYGDWSVIQRAIIADLKNSVKKGRKEDDAAYEERLANLVKKEDSFSIAYLDECVSKLGVPYEGSVEKYFAGIGVSEDPSEQQINLLSQIENNYTDAKELLETPYPKGLNLAQDKVSIEKIKRLLDSLKELQHFIKPLLGSGEEPEKDESFYGEFISLWETLDSITPLYDKVRNYATRKPYSEEKIKINFENAMLMKGWDQNKERDNTTVILVKDGLYYLAIMNKKFNNAFAGKVLPSSGECYQKMDYKLLPGANKMLPKVFFSKSRISEFAPSQELMEHYEQGTHKKGDKFSLKDCHELIDFFKASIEKHEDWSKFNFQFSDTSTYNDLSDFYREVEQQGYKISFRDVSVEYIDKLVSEGKLYLFQIYNKDFSPYSKGTPNIHTLYWKMLFDERNLRDVIYKLNGEAEVFFRKKSLKYERPTHPANQPIKNKGLSNPKAESVFAYDLIKDRRYTVDQFQLHVPITMNFKSTGNGHLNELVYDYLKEADDTYVIGIDRGERNLLYLCLIDSKGRICEQCSLNGIENDKNGTVTDYHKLLDKKEAERLEARQSWQSIENIKELKEGYLSQVIHKIATLMVEHKAIVVLEDLNFGFMRGRQKVEKQIYQKFERKLIEKLNYLVDKKKDPEEPGGLLHAYQLTSEFDSFQKLGKQSGFLFYIPAWNTSKIDPVTGFANLFKAKYETVEKSKSFFCKFKSIRYNSERDWFEWSFDYNDFDKSAEGTKTQWTLCTYGERIITYRNAEKNSQWDNRRVILTDECKHFFEKNAIDYHGNIKEQIAERSDKKFFEGLYQLLKLTLQMRNSWSNTDEDYLISPVMDEQGEFYDSRRSDGTLPKDADANGAYNIARKGLWVIRQIKQSSSMKELKLAISNKEWLRFAQEKPYLED
jgi:CRISPR-associated protein Cpf1